jgi:transcriptional antiterminator RfaH
MVCNPRTAEGRSGMDVPECPSPLNAKTAGQAQCKWLVINTLPHRETHACEHLTRQHFRVYCPMIMRRVRHARSVSDEPRPLFPGYVFVEHRLADPTWRPILGTQGVKSVVRSGDQPSLLCGSFIDELRAREVEGVLRKPRDPLEVGQRVTVQGTAFGGLVGQIIELRDKDRVMILLELLDKQTRVQLRTDNLSPV